MGSELGSFDRMHRGQTVEIGGDWYARFGEETTGPLDSQDEADAYVALMVAVQAARGMYPDE